MLLHTDSELICKFLQHDQDYVYQTAITIERRSQFLLIVVIHYLQVQPIMRSLAGNYTASCRDSEKFFENTRRPCPQT